jgi:hypothetical protein
MTLRRHRLPAAARHLDFIGRVFLAVGAPALPLVCPAVRGSRRGDVELVGDAIEVEAVVTQGGDARGARARGSSSRTPPRRSFFSWSCAVSLVRRADLAFVAEGDRGWRRIPRRSGRSRAPLSRSAERAASCGCCRPRCCRGRARRAAASAAQADAAGSAAAPARSRRRASVRRTRNTRASPASCLRRPPRNARDHLVRLPVGRELGMLREPTSPTRASGGSRPIRPGPARAGSARRGWRGCWRCAIGALFQGFETLLELLRGWRSAPAFRGRGRPSCRTRQPCSPRRTAAFSSFASLLDLLERRLHEGDVGVFLLGEGVLATRGDAAPRCSSVPPRAFCRRAVWPSAPRCPLQA